MNENLQKIIKFILRDIQVEMADTTKYEVSHFGFNSTTAKRYLRQFTEFGYLESHGENKNTWSSYV